jgi:[ribosomal protein S5]-alanine N-acetyltransferase
MELLTPRLKIREFRLTDFDALFEMDSDPRVCRYEAAPLTPAEVRYRLEGALEWAQEEPRKIYKLALTIPPDERVRGRLSLKINQPSTREWEIGWTLHPSAWGCGYASEGALALLGFAFTRLYAHRVVAFCHAQNEASVRVMQRIGMQPEGRLRGVIYLNQTWHDELIYSILDREFSTSPVSE